MCTILLALECYTILIEWGPRINSSLWVLQGKWLPEKSEELRKKFEAQPKTLLKKSGLSKKNCKYCSKLPKLWRFLWNFSQRRPRSIGYLVIRNLLWNKVGKLSRKIGLVTLESKETSDFYEDFLELLDPRVPQESQEPHELMEPQESMKPQEPMEPPNPPTDPPL